MQAQPCFLSVLQRGWPLRWVAAARQTGPFSVLVSASAGPGGPAGAAGGGLGFGATEEVGWWGVTQREGRC